jgi:hypothetical protein
MGTGRWCIDETGAGSGGLVTQGGRRKESRKGGPTGEGRWRGNDDDGDDGDGSRASVTTTGRAAGS